VTGRVFTKLFFSFVLVLFLGMAVLEFSLRPVMEQSLRQQAEESLAGKARLLAVHLGDAGPASDPASLARIARLDAAAAGAEVAIFDAQGRLLAGSQDHPGIQAATQAPEVAAVLDHNQPLGRAQRGDILYVAVPAGSLVVRLAYP